MRLFDGIVAKATFSVSWVRIETVSNIFSSAFFDSKYVSFALLKSCLICGLNSSIPPFCSNSDTKNLKPKVVGTLPADVCGDSRKPSCSRLCISFLMVAGEQGNL